MTILKKTLNCAIQEVEFYGMELHLNKVIANENREGKKKKKMTPIYGVSNWVGLFLETARSVSWN